MLGYYSIFNKSRQDFADKFNSQQYFKRQGSSWMSEYRCAKTQGSRITALERHVNNCR